MDDNAGGLPTTKKETKCSGRQVRNSKREKREAQQMPAANKKEFVTRFIELSGFTLMRICHAMKKTLMPWRIYSREKALQAEPHSGQREKLYS